MEVENTFSCAVQMDSNKVFIASSDANKIVDVLTTMPHRKDEVIAILVADSQRQDWQPLVESLQSTQRIFFGGVFPSILHEGKQYETGTLILSFKSQSSPIVISKINPLDDFSLEFLPTDSEISTALVLVDGLAGGSSIFLEELYNELGNKVQYWGGGAGSLDGPKRPCLFTQDGLFGGGAIVVLCSWHAELGVRHGWTPLVGSLVATRSEGNIVHELNWRPAAEVYAEQVSVARGENIDVVHLSDIWDSYPLGIRTEGEEFIVRDIVQLGEEGSLVFAGDVPENAVLLLLTGEPKDLLVAAEQAASDATTPGNDNVQHCLLADCVSRSAFLGENFNAELQAINHGLDGILSDSQPCGVLSIGEIASHDGYLEFFNKTCVVAVLYEK